MADQRTEIGLLLCCARTHVDPARAEHIKTVLRQNLDWTYLLRMASQHGMIPLVYWNLSSICPDLVPKVILDQLQSRFRETAACNLFLTGELLKLLTLLESRGIPAISYKGPALAAAVYGNLALRQFGDLDILVHQQDLPRAKDLVIAEGYSLEQTQSYHYGFYHQEFGCSVELHWALAPRHFYWSFDLERLWKSREQISLAGTMVRSFAPEDLLLILCVHGSKHRWQYLKWICDVGELIRVHERMDWKEVMEQARELGSERMLSLGLLLARDLLGTSLPDQVLQRIRADLVATSLVLQVREWLFGGPSRPVGVFENRAFILSTRERLRDRLRSLVHFLRHVIRPNERDQAVLPLPPFLFFLYYLLRPIRLIAEYSPLRRFFCRRDPSG